jgi:hypothetical protein
MHVLVQQIAMFQKEENFQFLFAFSSKEIKAKILITSTKLYQGYPEKILYSQKIISLIFILLTWRIW